MKKSHLRSTRGSEHASSELMPGVLYAARVELAVDDRFQVSLITGQTLLAQPAPGVDTRLILQALAHRTLVFVLNSGESVEIQGVLQTQLTPTINEEGEFEVFAKRVRLTAEDGVRLSTPEAKLDLTADGRAKLTVERLTIDAAARMRVLSALVELP